MKRILSSKFLWGIPLALISFELCAGVILGYLAAKIFSGKKSGCQGKIKSLTFSVGSWRIHLHHWLLGLGVLIAGIFYSFIPFPKFSFGFLGGMIFQGILCYPDWHKIFIKTDKKLS
jgi:hypothetical protein